VLKKITGVVFGALEHEMFEEVGESPLGTLLILGTDVIPEVYCDQRDLGLAADDDVESIGEGRFGKVEAIEGGGISHGSAFRAWAVREEAWSQST
jgi:hypothetical protein